MKILTSLQICAVAGMLLACGRPPVGSTEEGDELPADSDLSWWAGSYTLIDVMGGGMKQVRRFTLDASGSMLFEVEDCHSLDSEKVGRWELVDDGDSIELLNEAGTAPFSMQLSVEDGDTSWTMRRVVEDGECVVRLTDAGAVDVAFERGAVCLAEGLECLDEDLAQATTWCEGEAPELSSCP